MLGDPVRRRILELLAAGELTSGDAHRRRPGRVRDLAARGLPAPAGAARARLRLGATRRRAAALRRPARAVAGGRRLARRVPPLLDSPARRAGHRARPRPPARRPTKGPLMIDVTHQISAVARTVGTRTLEAGEARVVTVSQSYPRPVEDVWDACTNRRAHPALVPAGHRRAAPRRALPAGGQRGRRRSSAATRRTRSRATWEYGGDVELDRAAPRPRGRRHARFTLEHIAHVDDERWTEFGPGAVGVGWDSMLLGLVLHLEGDAVDHAGRGHEVAGQPGGRAVRHGVERGLVRGGDRRGRGTRRRRGRREAHHRRYTRRVPPGRRRREVTPTTAARPR